MTDDKRMTRAEAVILCRFAKACCPQQTFDEYTPDAWFELLGDLLAADCKQAVINVVKRQPFVSPSEIREEVGKVRFRRIVEFSDGVGEWEAHCSAELDGPAEHQWRQRMYRDIADGAVTPENYQRPAIGTTKRDVAALLAGAFHRPEEADPGAPDPCTEDDCDDPWCNHGTGAA